MEPPGVRRPVEGGALTSEAVLSRPTADTKLGLTLTDLGRGQVLLLTSPYRVDPLPLARRASACVPVGRKVASRPQPG